MPLELAPRNGGFAAGGFERHPEIARIPTVLEFFEQREISDRNERGERLAAPGHHDTLTAERGPIDDFRELRTRAGGGHRAQTVGARPLATRFLDESSGLRFNHRTNCTLRTLRTRTCRAHQARF